MCATGRERQPYGVRGRARRGVHRRVGEVTQLLIHQLLREKSYTAVIKKVLHNLGIDYCVYLGNIGRGIAPGVLEVEEVDGVDRRAIGNWCTDVFGTHYDTRLPLPAMRAMAGFDSRRGRYIHPRSCFYGGQN